MRCACPPIHCRADAARARASQPIRAAGKPLHPKLGVQESFQPLPSQRFQFFLHIPRQPPPIYFLTPADVFPSPVESTKGLVRGVSGPDSKTVIFTSIIQQQATRRLYPSLSHTFPGTASCTHDGAAVGFYRPLPLKRRWTLEDGDDQSTWSVLTSLAKCFRAVAIIVVVSSTRDGA